MSYVFDKKERPTGDYTNNKPVLRSAQNIREHQLAAAEPADFPASRAAVVPGEIRRTIVASCLATYSSQDMKPKLRIDNQGSRQG